MAFSYGSRNYSQGVYGGADPPYLLSAIPIIVEIYDNSFARKGTYQSGVGAFLGCTFTLDESGCKNFTLFFAESVSIVKKDIISIKLFNSIDNFFTGVIRKTPIAGSTEANYNYSGFGLVDYLIRINGEILSYANKTIDYILNDIVDNIITAKTPIIKNASLIDPPNITLTSFDSNYSQITEILDTLKKIANSEGTYITGVNNNGEFFFKPRNEEVKKTLVVGKEGNNGIDAYEPTDITEAKTKYYVLDKDGNYVTEVSTVESTDIFEQKITAPDIDNTSIQKWAEGILAENELETRRATIEWKIEEQNPLLLLADGNIRIISNVPPETLVTQTISLFGTGLFGAGLFGGSQYPGNNLDDTLKVIEVAYVLNGNTSVRKIQLGALPVRFDEQMNNLRKDLIDLRVSLGR